ncbi:caspase-3-like protein [Dinothrombium tinctorium]|uniref:Caspase-3-like protein n=1 Tax=Dinothrombium tinctorium TaxID=1965070 RepID=A0A443QNM9_9ACAR|nr:caspase-3-like protein [Dinothrombium tinctorium]
MCSTSHARTCIIYSFNEYERFKANIDFDAIAAKFKSVFESIGYRVIDEDTKNLPHKDLIYSLQEYSKSVNSEIIVIIFLSKGEQHGKDEYFLCKDKPVLGGHIRSLFNNRYCGKGLEGKPKIFFFLADTSEPIIKQREEAEGRRIEEMKISFSCYFKTQEEANLCCNTLCEVIEKKAANTEFAEIMTEVTDEDQKCKIAKTKREKHSKKIESKSTKKKTMSDSIKDCCDENEKLRGFCVIINNSNFASDQNTCDLDEANLVSVFGDFLAFKIKIHKNLDAEKMMETLKNVANDDELNDCDVFVVIVIADGDEQNIFCSNGSLSINQILTVYDSNNCSKLDNKSKIFFFIGDRGTKKDTGVLEDDDSYFLSPISPRIDSETAVEAMRTPRHRLLDAIVCYSTTSGYVSHKNSDGSSWYCQALCKVLRDHARDTEIMNLLRLVDAEVYEMETEDGCVQTSSFQCFGWRKKLYLVRVD